MNQNNNLNIGLFGFGVVGEGIYNVLKETPTLSSEIIKICIKHPNKKRNAPEKLFTTEKEILLQDPNINVIVELIDDADEAYYIVTQALKNKKHVVSANKKLIARHFTELIKLSQENNVSFLYEAAVCGSIPIIRNLEEYYDNDWLYGFSGIINGCTNFILTQMRKDKLNFSTALSIAQKKGFAESDPSLDTQGWDAANKLSILSAHIYGQHWSPDNFIVKGIQSLHENDIEYANEKKLDIKLIAQNFTHQQNATPIVIPTFIEKTNPLYNLDNEFNGVLLKSILSDEQFLYGKGAGRYPTSSAVLSDLSALRYGYRYEYRKALLNNNYKLSYDISGKFYLSYPSQTLISDQLFDEIESTYRSQHRNNIIGNIKLENLFASGILDNDEISIILFDGSLRQDNPEYDYRKSLFNIVTTH